MYVLEKFYCMDLINLWFTVDLTSKATEVSLNDSNALLQIYKVRKKSRYVFYYISEALSLRAETTLRTWAVIVRFELKSVKGFKS